jgi:hypothetical protein
MKFTHRSRFLAIGIAASLACLWLNPGTDISTAVVGSIAVLGAGAHALKSQLRDPNCFGACDPFDAMRVATESLDKDLLRRASQTSLWMNAITKGKYPVGVGVTQTVFTIENSEPTSDNETWTDITLTNGEITVGGSGNGCDITYNQAEVGFTEQTYGPRQFGLKGPVICKDSLTFQHQPEAFLNAYEQELSKRAKRSWEFEMRRTYMIFSEKWVDGVLSAGASTPISAADIPTSELTQDMLDEVAAALIETDATTPDSSGYVTLSEEGPLFTLYIGMRASARLLKNNEDRRLDARAVMAATGTGSAYDLFKRIGASRAIGNFRHVITTIPPRFNVVSGVLVQVPTFVMTATTRGKKASLNPNWKTAEYEGAIVVLPSVFEAEIVVPNNGTAWAKFDPTSYLGEWQFVKGAHRLGLDCVDPLEKLGQHYAEFKYAPRPKFPEHGKLIIFKRCPNDIALAACSGSGSA